MRARIPSCILCGYVIWDYESPTSESWLKQFRAVCSSSTDAWISGVGLYSDPDTGIWIVPPDYHMRWDDVGYLSPACHRLMVGEPFPNDVRHGFVLHDACWSLLQKACRPHTVPVARLLEICKSLPFPFRTSGVCWGHDYGGLVVLDNRGYTGEDLYVDRGDDAIERQHARENPFHVPDVYQLLHDTRQVSSNRAGISFLGPIEGGQDCFTKIPMEIREEVAVYLPTSEYLSLRQVSRAFGPILSSMLFWASRFEANADRAFLFEARTIKEPRNWRSLYHRTNNIHITRGLRNRRRVWELIQSLMTILRMRLSNSSKQLPSHLDPPGLRWREVSGDLRLEKSGWFDGGCRLFHRQRTLVPDSLSQIAFSIIRLGDAEYIAGIRFLSASGADVCLGYRSMKEEVFLDVSVLKGFVLVVGAKGIRALQVITGDGSLSQWFGCPTGFPKTHRLAAFGSIVALEAGFDGFKMVSLAAAEAASSYIATRNRTIRDTALWYTQIPETDLELNDECFIGEDPSAAEYLPLCWTSFGGPSGIYLRFLTGITGILLGSLCGVKFHYNTDEVPAECRKLGRCKSTKYTHVVHFPIDGPGGEIIETVEVSFQFACGETHYTAYERGKVRSLKIATNRGNSVHFQPRNDSLDPPVLEPMRAARGTTITGFYTSPDRVVGLVSFGIVSEHIRNE